MYGLVGDIGGTNVRFGLVDLASIDYFATSVLQVSALQNNAEAMRVGVGSIKVLTVADYPTLESALHHYLSDLKKAFD